jgi:two-component system sensor kinase FixL
MGLGLSIARTIVEAHGGRIWAESDGCSGATLHFTLPAVVAAAEPKLAEHPT